MQRRGFLKAILAAGVAPAFVGSGILMPVKALVMPTDEEVLDVVAGQGNTLLTIGMITREAMRILHENRSFVGTINRQFDEAFTGETMRIRRPQPWTA